MANTGFWSSDRIRHLLHEITNNTICKSVALFGFKDPLPKYGESLDMWLQYADFQCFVICERDDNQKQTISITTQFSSAYSEYKYSCSVDASSDMVRLLFNTLDKFINEWPFAWIAYDDSINRNNMTVNDISENNIYISRSIAKKTDEIKSMSEEEQKNETVREYSNERKIKEYFRHDNQDDDNGNDEGYEFWDIDLHSFNTALHKSIDKYFFEKDTAKRDNIGKQIPYPGQIPYQFK